ncbi:MAG TPA: hypothetical protein VF601_15520 [Beijerinckiaceae bacterium]|jgi:predicted transcriptional regulator
MTKAEALEVLIERIAEWPEEAQNELMRSVLDIEQKHVGVYRLSDEERAAIAEGSAQADRGEFATDAEMEDLRKRYGI